jgi:hypothetical protein
MTHTYAHLEVDYSTYETIRVLLAAAGYEHVFHKDDGYVMPVIDMHGIALACKDAKPSAISQAMECYEGLIQVRAKATRLNQEMTKLNSEAIRLASELESLASASVFKLINRPDEDDDF